MKWHISSCPFTKLDDFLPFVYCMVEWSLDNKKKCVFCWYTVAEKRKFDFFSITEPCRDHLKPLFLIKRSYYVVLTFWASHKIHNSLQTHVHVLLILMSCLYHLLFFSSLKSTKLQKNEKKLDKNVIAKLSGNKVILLRKKCPRPLTFLYNISK